MTGLLPHQQMLVNEIVSVLEAHSPTNNVEKIDWTNFLTFLTKLIELLVPVLIPLIVAPPTPPVVKDE